MTLWPDQPTKAGTPPQTRRQARENERAHDAGTDEVPGAASVPLRENPAERSPGFDEPPAIPATAFADPGVSAPNRSAGGFESLVFNPTPIDLPDETPERVEPARSQPVAQPDANDDVKNVFGLFRQTPEQAAPEPPTRPMTAVPPPSVRNASAERALTRRELRALQQAHEVNEHIAAPEADEPTVYPTAFRPGADAEPSAAPLPSSDQKTSWPFATQKPSQQADAVTPSAFTSFGLPGASGPSSVPDQPSAPSAPPATAPEPSQERRPYTPPAGHWSTAAEIDDKNQPITSRNVGHSTAATTTNALILPSLPHPDATAPLTSTGEILITGSIDLPRSLGSTGVNPARIDSSDIDRLLDGEENEFNTSEVAPVRASRAVSTHTSTRGVIAPPKKRGNAVPLVLMVTAGVLAIGVIGLLVAAYVLKIF